MDRILPAPAINSTLNTAGAGLWGGIVDRIVDSIADALTGGAASTLAGLTSFFNTKHAELAELQSKTQALEGVIGYAHAYVDGSISTTAGDKKLAMTNQIGPKTGVTITSGSFYLGSKGLWVADAHCTFDFLNVGVTALTLAIRVYTPGGSLYAQRWAVLDSNDETTLAVHMPFTVPASGYYVEMWCNAALGRGIFGGSANNGLSVNKVSTETS